MFVVNRVVGSQGADPIGGTGGADIVFGFDPGAVETTGLSATLVSKGLAPSRPVQVVASPVHDSLVFVPTLIGRIEVVDTSTGQRSRTPLLDITGEYPPLDDVTNLPGRANDKGLCAMAFHPDFARNGKFYTYRTDYHATVNQIFEYTVQPGTLVADISTRRLVAEWAQPSTVNHRVGWLGFGPDGFLYVVRADGGNPYDPLGVTQDPDSTLGKILRIDLSRDDFPGDPKRNYGIPSDNPYADGDGAPEIWATGVRNSFRNSFDSVTGDFWVADVGQETWEEVNRLPAGTAPGANLGWVYWEGNQATALNPDPTDTAGYTFPIHTFPHGQGENNSVSGGFVYRGTSEAMQEHYVFGDFSQGRIYTLEETGGAPIVTERTGDIAYDSDRTISNPVHFGRYAAGDLFVLDIDGGLFRLTPEQAGPADAADTIAAGDGDDFVYVGGGADEVDGGEGSDVLSGMGGGDTLLGGEGEDSLVGAAGDDSLLGGEDMDTLLGGEGLDTLGGEGGPDALDGGGGNDSLRGGDGEDTLFGSDGTDNLYGDAGDDLLSGGAHKDFLTGGAGADRLIGGAAADRFTFRTASESTPDDPDTIVDFAAGQRDKIHIRALAGGKETFIGTDGFAGAGSSELRHEATAGGVLVEADLNGDGAADFALRVLGVASVQETDFML